MKKIVALGAIAALAGGMIFADEPAIDMKVAEFSGNAEVKWGMDLDAGQHGFTNSEDAKLKINLWNGGTKATEGSDIWAELKIEAKGGAYENGDLKDGAVPGTKPEVKEGKLHFGDNFYIGIRKGSTQVGDFSLPAAVRGEKIALDKKGVDFTQGIEAGWSQDEFAFALNFRSLAKNTNYTSAYGLSATAELKDNLVPGLTAKAGVSYNLSDEYKDKAAEAVLTAPDTQKASKLTEANWKDGEEDYVNTIVAGITAPTQPTETSVKLKGGHTVGYGFNAGYKFAIDDTYYVKPSAGISGSFTSGSYKSGSDWKAASSNENTVIAGVLFGWGDINKDDKPSVPFLDTDDAKKVSPGVSVNVKIPLTTTYKFDDVTVTSAPALKALIVPSVYLGTLVENLNFAAYSEIGLLNYYEKAEDRYKEEDKTVTIKNSIDNEKETTALALAAGLSYKATLDNDVTVTPKAGFRYINSSYAANKTTIGGSDVFKDWGIQKLAKDADKKTYDADFFNLKAGVEVGGVIDNVTFSANYTSANLLNGISDDAESVPAYAKDTKYYNVKLGTFDIGCKISL